MKHHQSPTPFVPDTHQQVQQFLAENEKSRGPLTGLRLAVKDLFHMQGLPTTAGNPTWLSSHDIPPYTSSAVQMLLNAGAEFIGKTLTDELAYSLEGRNIHYGTPVNPVAPQRLPGGSSSGSAVAVASELADIGLGTDTGGSIRVPASYNGLYGLRPSHGVVAMDHVIPLAPRFDTVGWLTRDLNAMIQVARVSLGSSLSVCEQFNLGVADNLIEQCLHGRPIMQWLQQHIQQKNVGLTGFSLPITSWRLGETFRTLQGYAIISTHGEWLAQTKPAIAPDIQVRLDWSRTLKKRDVLRGEEQAHIINRDLTALFEHYDALVIPTTPGPAPLLNTPVEALSSYRNQLLDFTAIAGIGGLPQLHVPACTTDGAPCGFSLIGRRGSDLTLLAMAQRLTE